MKYKVGDQVRTKCSCGTILNAYSNNGVSSYLIKDDISTNSNWTYGEFIIGKIDDCDNDTQSCVFNVKPHLMTQTSKFKKGDTVKINLVHGMSTYLAAYNHTHGTVTEVIDKEYRLDLCPSIS